MVVSRTHGITFKTNITQQMKQCHLVEEISAAKMSAKMLVSP